jgi:hypothetical protein
VGWASRLPIRTSVFPGPELVSRPDDNTWDVNGPSYIPFMRPLLQKKSTVMSRLKIKPLKSKASLSDIATRLDAIFDPNHEMPGWVLMLANAKGREHIEDLFPQAVERCVRFPDDWRSFKVQLASIVKTTETKLPLDCQYRRGQSRTGLPTSSPWGLPTSSPWE